jgi:hypothetical protein
MTGRNRNKSLGWSFWPSCRKRKDANIFPMQNKTEAIKGDEVVNKPADKKHFITAKAELERKIWSLRNNYLP